MSTKVVTGEVRFSYLQVFEPKAIEDGADPKYSVSLVISKDDKKTIAKFEAAIEAAKEQGKSKWGGKTPANLKLPLRDGDKDRPDDPVYENCMFVNATSKQRPGLVDGNVDPIMDQTELYSGCYGRASVNLYPFSVSGNKGIACGLNHLQKTKDGTPLGGKNRPEDDFDAVESDSMLD